MPLFFVILICQLGPHRGWAYKEMTQHIDDYGYINSCMAYVDNVFEMSFLDTSVMAIDEIYAWIWDDKVFIRRALKRTNFFTLENTKRSDVYINFLGNDDPMCYTCEKNYLGVIRKGFFKFFSCERSNSCHFCCFLLSRFHKVWYFYVFSFDKMGGPLKCVELSNCADLRDNKKL